MKVDFGALIRDMNGVAVSKDGKDLTLETVTVEALLGTTQADASLSGEEKFKRFELALKCKGVVDIKVEDAAQIKKRVGEVWTPLVVGRAWSLLDGATD